MDVDARYNLDITIVNTEIFGAFHRNWEPRPMDGDGTSHLMDDNWGYPHECEALMRTVGPLLVYCVATKKKTVTLGFMVYIVD